ncbi:MAG: ferric reductase-like transmembrane domain-containing protein [Candidatus Micrarchaeota archaeon]
MPELQPAVEPEGRGLLTELDRKKGYILKSCALLLAYWLAFFGFQYFFVSQGSFLDSFIRASSIGGALLIGLALSTGPLQALVPRLDFTRFRRTLGVAGFLMVAAHSFAVVSFRFGGDFVKAYSNLNPFQSAIAFGVFAYWLAFPLALSSTDWAMRKLRFKHWKLLHRTVYFSWILAVMHFLLIRPEQLRNAAGYLLLLVTGSVFALQLAAFAKRAAASRARLALAAGLSVVLFLASLFVLSLPKISNGWGI